LSGHSLARSSAPMKEEHPPIEQCLIYFGGGDTMVHV